MSRDEEQTAAPDSVWGALPTEARHPESLELDRESTERIVARLLEEDRRGIEAAGRCGERIAEAASWMAATLEAGGDALLLGAGTSGRLAVLEAAECPPTFGSDPRRIRAVMAGGPEAVFAAREGAEDRDDDGARAVAGLEPQDLVIGISASSVTSFVRGALVAARERRIRTVLLTCAGPDGLEEAADLVIALATGPEILTGSTRLKAGSATKAALNAITTAAMVELGKVYQNLMVDLRPASAKLRDRARRIVAAAAGVGPEEAAGYCEAAGYEVKTAIVMARLGISADEARRRLEASGGRVRRVLDGST